ncbi:NADH-quinone oxidoreductase subunit C, partial [Streptomyces sp. NPDC127074]
EGSASQRPAGADQRPAGAEPTADTQPPAAERPAPRTRSSDAPWHHARPARDEDAETPREPEAAAEAPEAEGHGDERGGEKPGPASGTPDAPETNSDDQPGGTA